MCGIHGLVALREGALPAPDVLDRMGRVTRHRGPDDAGAYHDAGVLLGMLNRREVIAFYNARVQDITRAPGA